MATSLKQISEFLEEMELKHKVDEEKSAVICGFVVKKYKDRDGKPHLLAVIRVDEDGEYLSIFVPGVYFCRKDNPHLGAMFETAMRMHWSHKLLTWEYNHHDGEFRASVPLAIEDSELTADQFRRCLLGLISMVDRSYPKFTQALETGSCEPARTPDPAWRNVVNATGTPPSPDADDDEQMPTPADIGLAE